MLMGSTGQKQQEKENAMGFAPTTMQVSSNDFETMGAIPRRCSHEGEDESPALSWTDPPEGTQGFAVFCHDPDAPLVSGGGTYGFVHWVLYNLPGDLRELPGKVSGYTVGKNDFGGTGYGGPMPPEGHGRHHYYFWVLALSEATDLPEGLSLWELLEKLEDRILGMNRLIGHYERSE